MNVKKIKYYKTVEDKEPYKEWFLKLDNSQKAIVLTRLKRVEAGNYGFHKVLSSDLTELKFTNGLRIYFTEVESIIVLLLCGGGKKRQSNDINKAQEYLNDYINRSKDND